MRHSRIFALRSNISHRTRPPLLPIRTKHGELTFANTYIFFEASWSAAASISGLSSLQCVHLIEIKSMSSYWKANNLRKLRWNNCLTRNNTLEVTSHPLNSKTQNKTTQKSALERNVPLTCLGSVYTSSIPPYLDYMIINLRGCNSSYRYIFPYIQLCFTNVASQKPH